MNVTETSLPDAQPIERQKTRQGWVWVVLLVGVILVGAYFRMVGVNWDDGQHLHPDERFLTMVASSISPVNNIGDYFNTATSSLNPNNRGFGFYVYGTLPLFIVRAAADLNNKTGYGDIHLVGRQLSAVFDLLTVLVVYLIGLRLFRKHRLGLLAAAFAACSVLPIQLSHYFGVDTFANFFSVLTIYFAVRVMTATVPLVDSTQGASSWWGGHWSGFLDFAFFGVSLGLAVSSKILAAPLAVLLPVAAFIRWMDTPADQRMTMLGVYVRNMAAAALLALLLFRIGQPYAFSGPGFFGISLNPRWLANMRELSNQNSGDVDFPPQLQWARRPLWFSLQNMVLWGMGLPLGLLAWAGFLAMGWRILRGEWKKYLLLWGWTAVYFTWQAVGPTKAMRYELLVYPTLALIAAWALFALWDWGQTLLRGRRIAWQALLAVVVGAVVLGGTAAWAYAFTRIYTRPVTRVEASRWIYQNVPGPINLHILTPDGSLVNQPVAYRAGIALDAQQKVVFAFKPDKDGSLNGLTVEHLGDTTKNPPLKSLVVAVGSTRDGGDLLSYSALTDTFSIDADPRGRSYTLNLTPAVQMKAGETYYLSFQLNSDSGSMKLGGPLLLIFDTADGVVKQPLPEPVEALREGQSYQSIFIAVGNGTVQDITLDHMVDWQAFPDVKKMHLALYDFSQGEQPLGTADLESAFAPGKDIRGDSYTFRFDQPVQLTEKKNYTLKLTFEKGPGQIGVYGSKQANESTWDDALPLGLDGFDPYDYTTGVYRSDLNFEMYWDDNTEKLQRFQSTLDQADYIFISSNRQWGTTVRVPERYPLTSLYYRSLLGCPAEQDLLNCYRDAQPGMYQGNLGFELAAVFQSDPTLGSLRINDQYAEEPFTVYDHPKVLIFKKTDAYRSDQVRALLKTVDLNMVVHLTPGKAASFPGTLMLPEERLAQQRAGGTWSQLFDRAALINSSPVVTVLVWYLLVLLLGWVNYPFVRMALRGLPDKGYPLSKLVGLLLLAYLVWMAASLGGTFDRWTIGLAALGLVLVNAALAWWQRRELAEELRTHWKYFLKVELAALAFFSLFLLVRLGNPDLWHPYKGGEKPMDFSYFNAVLKSSTFPPYDPWFAGGYINYYYFGFVLAGVPVKWLGIVPAVAYNLILPTFFSFLAMGGFSLVWNLVVATWRERRDQPGSESPFAAGLTGAFFLTIAGNLGTIRMIWQGLMRLAAPGASIEMPGISIFTKIGWTFSGLAALLKGGRLPFYPGDWYWIPSRAFPKEPITEFPAFTFLYADLHAHMLALPLTVLALSWAISVVLGRWRWGDGQGRGKLLHFSASFVLGGLAIGALRPTNTWDFPTYLAFGLAAVVYSALRWADFSHLWVAKWPNSLRKLAGAAACAALLTGLALVLYQPYAQWYGQGYNAVEIWNGDRTPFWSFITHWGLFLFLVISWLSWETIEWMAATPLSALNKLRPYQPLLLVGLGLLAAGVVGLLVLKVNIAWLVLPVAVWAALLLFRPGLPEARRIVLFMVGTALVLTLMVELIVLKGDLGRMNTVFKFYLQAWTLFAAAGAVSLAWIFPIADRKFSRGWRSLWYTGAAVLIGCAGLFPLMGGLDKVTDRMSTAAPHTLDGMAYMATSHYTENNLEMNLSEDYRAIQWMQAHVQGSPVIVEGNVPEYRWGTRYTIYTGLPGVVGWNWHQRQQRALTPPEWVTDRVDAVGAFYNTASLEAAQAFLNKYDVRYIIVGQMERAIYLPEGLAKFDTLNGGPWTEVYRDGQTVIYQVK